MQKVKRNILLNPGPATTTDSVKYAQIIPDICPREEEFSEILKWVSLNLTEFVANTEEYTSVLIGGSGTAAVESVISSVVGEGLLLIINNGAYGKRMIEIAQAYELNYDEYVSDYLNPIDLEQLERNLQGREQRITHLAVVHNETTTGLLNDIHAIGTLCKKYKIDLIVDAMSSYGAIPIHMVESNIDYLVASSNKNLQGLPGVSFVIGNKEKIKHSKQVKANNYYLNLYKQYSYFEEHGQMKFTPPVQTLYALKQAIIETKNEGIINRHKRYTDSWKTLISGIEKLNLEYLVPIEHQSRIITAIKDPKHENYNFDEMHDFLYDKGFTIYPGKIEGNRNFRIANIGDINRDDIQLFLSHLEAYFQTISRE
ncbi:2-aminoethylphosphonate aminotransferase [Paenibacillus sp. FSL H8-0537]|uniref:2-aminoethylphosphonate aminotransferase n=1 Tax=Paenibacillus sp. FSL H8-0537 TaxID=2921399 RepID=UPI003100C867